MYRVLTEQRAAHVIGVPRLGAGGGFAIDVPAVRAAGRDAAVIWLCSPNNPHRRGRARRGDRRPAGGRRCRHCGRGTEAPIVVLDEAYAEFVGTTLIGSASSTAPARRTDHEQGYGLAGLRVGFAIGTR